MRDIIFTIIAAWVVYKIFNSISNVKAKSDTSKEGTTTVNQNYSTKKPHNNDEGEYVDYEEIK